MTVAGLTAEQAARQAAQQRQYTPASQAQSPCEAAQAAYETLRRLPSRQQEFNTEVQTRADYLEREVGVKPDEIARFVTAERAKFADTADAQIPGVARRFMAERRAAADCKVDSIRAALSPKSNDIAELVRQQQVWDRERKILDAKASNTVAAVLAADAIAKAADPEELAVYAAELPAYFQARGFDDTSFVDQALTAKVPEYAAAQAEQREEQIYAQVTDHLAGYMDRCVASGRPADPRVLAKLDPKKIQQREQLGRR